MSATTINEAWPDFGRAFTVAELDRMPADGRRYELLDGALVVSPGRRRSTSSSLLGWAACLTGSARRIFV